MFLSVVATQPAPLPAAACRNTDRVRICPFSSRLGRRPQATWGRDHGEGEQGVGWRGERMELDPGFVEGRKAGRE